MAGVFAVFGAGGFGREVVGLAEDQLRADLDDRETVFVSDFDETILNGRRLLRLEQLGPGDEIVIAVSDPAVRRALALRCEARGIQIGTIWVRCAHAYGPFDVGHGAIICPGSIITANAKIGRHFHLNLNSYVAHDCVIGDFVTFAPFVGCNGHVTVEDDVYVGTGALIRPGIRIGRGATIGMGAVVIKDVSPGDTVVGNPARAMQR
jgi:sugar O-acyltransferase (sialic acid O-acetyltransferase NeuD family)